MNFFERQEKARQNTSYLIFLFVVAVLGIVAATCAAVFVAYFFIDPVAFAEVEELSLWQKFHKPLAVTVACTLMVILSGALYKWQLLGNKGAAVAEYLGGRLVDRNSKDPDERKLVNVVEEMAIAAGVPVPLIYIMHSEHSINAFAAGLTPYDAVVCVTKGLIENLTRDELQGVIAHEFSHIFNGDMKLNMRLIGYLAGIVTIGIIGRYLLESMMRGSRRRSKDGDKGALIIVALGLALMTIGFLGTFVGRLIRAAISRQREFLADATAVQYTRYPAGIAGALAKIGDLGSRIVNGRAEEASHMFIDNPVNAFVLFGGALATHPPLKKRIAAIDERFLDPKFLERELKFPERTSRPQMHEKYTRGILDNIGEVEREQVAQAAALIAGFSGTIQENYRDPVVAQALSLSLLLREAAYNEEHSAIIESHLSPNVAAAMGRCLQEIKQTPFENHLAIFELCAPSLRQLSPSQRLGLMGAAEKLARFDQQISLLEATYLLLLKKVLTADEKHKPVSHYGMNQVWENSKMVLAALAHHGHEGLEPAQAAFTKALKKLGKVDSPLPPRSFCDGKSLMASLEAVARLKPIHKQLVIEACFDCVEHDGVVTQKEVELLRAITSALDAPIPPPN